MVARTKLSPIETAVVTSSLDGIVIVDEEGRVLALNPAAETMFGYAKDEARGRRIAELIVPEHLRETHSRGFDAYLAGGPPKVIGRRVETEAVCKDGRVFPVELTVMDIEVDGRRVFTANVRDRSQHAARDEELQETRRQLELAVEGAQIGIWSYDPRTGISWYSDRVKEIVGFEENLLADGEAFRQRVHPEDRAELVFDRDDDFPEGRVAREYRVVRPDGEIRWLYSLGTAARDADGRVEAIHGVIIDVTERKRAEDALESTRQQLELAVQGAKLGAWSFDPRTYSCWFSDRAVELLGLESNHMEQARDLEKHVHPDDWGKLVAPYYGIYPDEPLELEYRVVLPDGSIRWIHALGAAVRGKDGELQNIHGIQIDITERKRAEAELEQTRGRLGLAVDGARLGAWSFDFATGKTWYSERSKEIYGLPPETEMSTEVIRASLNPDDWEEVARPYVDGFHRDRVEVEYRIVRPDGAIRWVYSLGTAVRDETGAASMVNGIHLDITDRKQAEEELAAARRHLELAVEGARIGIWTVDPRSGETWYSDRSRDLWGVDKELRLDARTLKEYIHPDDWHIVLEPYRTDFPGDKIAFEHRIVWPNGDIRWVQSLGTAIRDENGAVTQVSGIHLDVTERRRSEEELARSREALHQSERLTAMGSLLAGVSHELNNPLAAVVGQAEMLQEDAAGTPFEARAAKIGSAAARCARIVQTFLAMARQHEPRKELIAVNDIVASALDLTDYALRTAGVAVRVTLGSSMPPVEGDRDQLHQVVVNLVVNAQQAMAGGGPFEKILTIRTSVNQSGEILIDVCDTGPGIPEKVGARVFEPFFTTKPQGSGTGVGLSFSQGIVEAHRGRLTLESSRHGAHFRIALPPAVAGAPIAVEVDRTRTGADGRGARALVVDDEADVRETLRELLEREGYEVRVADDGAAALVLLERDEFDLILSDLRMPGVSGADLHDRLAETKPHLVARMAFVTGDTLGADMDEFLSRCGRPVLEKPFTRLGVRCLTAAVATPAATA